MTARKASSAPAPPEPLGVLRGHGVAVNCVSFLSPSSVVSGGADGGVKIWDLKSRRERAANATAHSKAGVLHACSLSAGASSPRFVTQGRDGFVRVWDADSFGAGCAPLSEFYCGSFSFTKVATLRWPDAAHDDGGDGNAMPASLGQLIVAPNSDSDKARVIESSCCVLVGRDTDDIYGDRFSSTIAASAARRPPWSSPSPIRIRRRVRTST